MHGCQHEVTFAHSADEPVQLFKALPAVGIGLVLIGGLHGLFQLVVTGFRIEVAKLRSTERDEPLRQPFWDQVEPVYAGSANHPGPSGG